MQTSNVFLKLFNFKLKPIFILNALIYSRSFIYLIKHIIRTGSNRGSARFPFAVRLISIDCHPFCPIGLMEHILILNITS